MKLIYILAAVLALTLAEEEKKKEVEILEDSVAEAANMELLKEGVDQVAAASSYPSYVAPSQRPPQWGVQSPQNTWEPPKKPIDTWVQPPVQNDYYWSSSTPNYHPPTTTTPVPVIKNEHYIGDNGYYRYEYKIADGTHVSEEGWNSCPNQEQECLVKRGFYSHKGADGKTYTVKYWADKTGYHAYGDHLPTPPTPVNQPSYDNRPQHDYPEVTPAPQPIATTKPVYIPQKPAVVHDEPQVPQVPQVPTYNPTQTPSYPPQVPSYNPPQVPSYNPPQVPSYNPPQVPSYNPPQVPSYNPPQVPSYYPTEVTSKPIYIPPQQPTYTPPQQAYYPPQQPQYPQQTYVPNYNV